LFLPAPDLLCIDIDKLHLLAVDAFHPVDDGVVSLRAPSIMLAMSGIWLIGCQFTRSGERIRVSPLIRP
jgi:hypothetical protein